MTKDSRLFAVRSLNDAHSIAATLREVAHWASADINETPPTILIEAEKDQWNTVEDIILRRDASAMPIDLSLWSPDPVARGCPA